MISFGANHGMPVSFGEPFPKLVDGHCAFGDIAEFAAGNDISKHVPFFRVQAVDAATYDRGAAARVFVDLKGWLAAIVAWRIDECRKLVARKFEWQFPYQRPATIAMKERVCYRAFVRAFAAVNGFAAAAWVGFSQLIGRLIDYSAALASTAPNPIAVRLAARERQQSQAANCLTLREFWQHTACQW